MFHTRPGVFCLRGLRADRVVDGEFLDEVVVYFEADAWGFGGGDGAVCGDLDRGRDDVFVPIAF